MNKSFYLPLGACLLAGAAQGQGLYNIMPYEDDATESLPLHWTIGANIGYDTNPAPILSDCPGYDTDESLYVSGFVQANFASVTPQTAWDVWARVGITYYIDEVEQTSPLGMSVGSSDDTFYNARAGFNITHHVNERLRLRSRTYVSYETEPDYDYGISTDRRQGEYLQFSSDNSVGYRWSERFGTVTGYRILGTVWDDIDDEDFIKHLFYNQFRYRTTPQTVLTASIRYRLTDNDSGGDSDSWYFLVGAEHEFSETTVGVIRVGAQYFSPDNGDSGWSPYVEGTIRTQVNEQFSVRAFVYYGLESRNRSIWVHDCDAVSGLASPEHVLFDERQLLRIGSQASYMVSEMLTLFGGLNLIFDDYSDGTYRNGGIGFAPGDSASDFDETIFNVNLGASVKVTDNVYVTGSYNYTDASSDADIREYDRHRFQLGVQTSF